MLLKSIYVKTDEDEGDDRWQIDRWWIDRYDREYLYNLIFIYGSAKHMESPLSPLIKN